MSGNQALGRGEHSDVATNTSRNERLDASLERVAASSNGVISVRRITTRQLGESLRMDLGSSPNPVYEFTVTNSGRSFAAVAYTLSLDGTSRPATRAEALGRGLAQESGRLFDSNPFLLVFDFAGEQLLSVPAITLFGAFAERAAREPIEAATTSTFSLSPNFVNCTISMYGLVTAPDVWKCALNDLTAEALAAELLRIHEATTARRTAIPHIVSAIQSRLAQQPVTPALASANGGTAVSPAPARQLDAQDEQLNIAPRLWRMILTSIRSAPGVILVGPPGTAKTALLRQAIRELSTQGAVEKEPLWATPDESWSARDLIGGDTVFGGDIQFRPGWLLRAIADGRWLVLDEANRADMDRIFGPVLTWLSGGDVFVGTASAGPNGRKIRLGWTSGQTGVRETEDEVQFLAGKNWRLLGTYNALDAQRVFRFGAALGRRFARIPIPAIAPSAFAELLALRAPDLSESLRVRLANLYSAHFETDASRLGPAIFLSMCDYVRHGTNRVSPPAERITPTPIAAEPSTQYMLQGDDLSALAEAYVVHAGAAVAHLEEDELVELTSRIRSADVFVGADLEWVAEVIRSLV